jgi:hypothetical protein
MKKLHIAHLAALIGAFSWLLSPHDAQAKSVTREGEAVITFNKLYIPETLRQGQFYQISADLTTKKNIWEDMPVFVHLTTPGDNKVVINNDFAPSVATTQWTVGEAVRVGPVNAYIPHDIPPGTYNVLMGFYSTKISPEETLHIREPYTNPEIKDFVVGTVKVEEAPPERGGKKPDFVISDFESLVDLKKWQPRGVRIEQTEENVAVGKYACKITYPKGTGGCPSAILQNFFRYSDPKYADWSDYDILQFYIYGSKDKEGHTYLNYPVALQVKDKAEKRFQSPIPPTQDKEKPATFIISTIGKIVDITDIGNLSFFVFAVPADTDWVVYLDDIRLVSLGVEKAKSLFLKFGGLKIAKDKVKPGEEIEIEMSFSTVQRFAEDYGLFVHVYRSYDKAGWLNADMAPSPPTTEWEVNETITMGPYRIFIPSNSPPGKYDIEMGLFLEKQIPPGARYVKYHRGKNGIYYIQQPSYPRDYIKVPYSNYEEYGDWVVASFEVVAP